MTADGTAGPSGSSHTGGRGVDVDHFSVELDAMLAVERIIALRPLRGQRSAVKKRTPDGTLAPRSGSSVLVKWGALDYSHATWERWADVKALAGARRAWGRCASLCAAPPLAAPSDAERAIETSRAFAPLAQAALRLPDDRSLRQYQVEGVNWLLACWHARRSNILADEMGLGKTCQILLCLQWLCEHRRAEGPFLIVAPVSTLAHWEREVKAWTAMSAVVLHGPSEARRALLQHECRHTNAHGKPTGRLRFHVLITAPDCLHSELSALASIRWQYLVIDEAHCLKNPNTKLVHALKSLSAPHSTLLTGTPVQNDVGELLGLFSFLDPAAFGEGAREALLSRYGAVQRLEQVEELQALIRPYVLRRTKDELSQPLPSKRETLLKVALTPSQMRCYRAVMDRSLEHIQNPRSSLRNVFMQLRKACNHPMLMEEGTADEQASVEHALSRRSNSRRWTPPPRARPTPPPPPPPTPPPTAGAYRRDGVKLGQVEAGVQTLVSASGKMVLLHKLLPRLRAEGRKVLVFSQFCRMLDLLEDYLHLAQLPFERLDGSISGVARQASIDRFQRGDAATAFVFLLSTRAGGVGINLTAADTVVIFDSDWNPQGDMQGQARAHRIGQERPVSVFRLVTRGTYEERMLDRAMRKLSLERAILQPASFSAAKAEAAGAAKEDATAVAQEDDQEDGEGAGCLSGTDDAPAAVAVNGGGGDTTGRDAAAAPWHLPPPPRPPRAARVVWAG